MYLGSQERTLFCRMCARRDVSGERDAVAGPSEAVQDLQLQGGGHHRDWRGLLHAVCSAQAAQGGAVLRHLQR